MYSVAKIKKLYAKLPNEAAVAAELGVSRQFINEFRKKHNIPYDANAKRKKYLMEKYGSRNSTILKMYKADASIGGIADSLNITKTIVNYVISRAGIRKKTKHPSIKRNIEIHNLRKKGLSTVDIANRFKIKRSYVSNILYKMRIKENG